MRIAIFSDVHGNLTALEAVLDDIAKQAPDLTIFAGDLCVFGTQPAECVQRFREEKISGIVGDTDQWISNQPLLSSDIQAEERKRKQNVDTASDWAWAQLNEMDRAWLRTLPFYRRVSPTQYPKDDLFVVHANPRDSNRPILPPKLLQKRLYGEIKQPDDALRSLLEGQFMGILAFGHVHVPSIRYWRKLTLANISSVSLPQDGDVRAKYGLFTWQGRGGWAIEHRYVSYDIDAEVVLLNRLKPPKWKALSQRLQTANTGNLNQTER
ncbi:MAG TPA: metallophosphoesterase family protein [Anaerolineae bacterium]|nr:metallophosphoesterase family protein [Anaerolineae bacterium]